MKERERERQRIEEERDDRWASRAYEFDFNFTFSVSFALLSVARERIVTLNEQKGDAYYSRDKEERAKFLISVHFEIVNGEQLESDGRYSSLVNNKQLANKDIIN